MKFAQCTFAPIPKMEPATEIMCRLEARGLAQKAESIAEHYQISIDDMLGSRERVPTMARRYFWCLLYDTREYTYPVIARLFGKDNTTVRTGVMLHRERIECDLGYGGSDAAQDERRTA